MVPGAPSPRLAALLDGGDPLARERAWSDFLEEYSPVLLKAARRFGRDYDATMDRYRFVLEKLQEDDHRRLRAYEPRGRSTFAAWLVVVARRLCVDYDRARYGRGGRGADPDAGEEERIRRRGLADLTGVALDVGRLSSGSNPERGIRERELREALETAMGALDPRDRMLLKLRFEDGLPVRQIADVMRFPTVFHVYRRLNPALDRVRRGLLERGIGGPAP